MIKTSGTMKGLFTDAEMSSENVKVSKFSSYSKVIRLHVRIPGYFSTATNVYNLHTYKTSQLVRIDFLIKTESVHFFDVKHGFSFLKTFSNITSVVEY